MWVINPASALLADGTRTRREMAPIKFIFPPKMVSVIIGRFLSHWYIVYMVIWCYKNGETARSTAGSDLRRFGGTSVPRLYTTPECSTRSGYSSGAIGHIYLGCEPFFLSSVSRFQTTASTNRLHRRCLDSCFPWTRPGQADKQPPYSLSYLWLCGAQSRLRAESTEPPRTFIQRRQRSGGGGVGKGAFSAKRQVPKEDTPQVRTKWHQTQLCRTNEMN